MNKREIKILKAAFAAEVHAGVHGGIDIYQNKSKLAEKLAKDGLLENASTTLVGRFPVKITGYRLTHAGRLLYCGTC